MCNLRLGNLVGAILYILSFGNNEFPKVCEEKIKACYLRALRATEVLINHGGSCYEIDADKARQILKNLGIEIDGNYLITNSLGGVQFIRDNLWKGRFVDCAIIQ